jgi:hypothetical protein
MSATEPIRDFDSAARWYRRLVNLYPGPFRARHGEEMLHIFEVEWVRARVQGRKARWRYGRSVVWDLLRTLPKELFLAAPIMWLLSVVLFSLALTLDPASGCCALVFLAFIVMLNLTSGPVSSGLLALSSGPIGFCIARLLEFAHAYEPMRGRIDLDLVALISSACYGWNLSLLLSPVAKMRAIFRAKRGVYMLVFFAISAGFILGGTPWKCVMRALPSVCLLCAFGRALYLKVWRGARFPALEGPLFVRRPLDW